MRPRAIRTVAWVTGAALMLSQSCSGIAAEQAAEMTVSAELLSEEWEETAEISEEITEEIAEITEESAEIEEVQEEAAEEIAEIPEETIEITEETVEIMEEPVEIMEECVEIEEAQEEAAQEITEIMEEPEEAVEEISEIPEVTTEIPEETVEIAEETVEITEEPEEAVEEIAEIMEEPEEIAEEEVAEETEESTEEPEETAEELKEIVEETEETAEEPEEITEEPEETTAEFEEITAEPEEITAEPEEIMMEPEEDASELEEVVEEFEEIMTEPKEIAEETEEVTGKPAEETEELFEEVLKEETPQEELPEETIETEEPEVIVQETMQKAEPGKATEELLQEDTPIYSLIEIGEPEFAPVGEMEESGGHEESPLRLNLSLEEAALKSNSLQVYVESTNKAVEDRLSIRQMEDEAGKTCTISLEGIPEDQSGDGIYLITVLASDLQGNLISSRKEIRINRYGSVYELLSDADPVQNPSDDPETAHGQDNTFSRSERMMQEDASERDVQYLPLQISERNVDEIVSSKIFYSRNGEELRQCDPEAVRISSAKTSDGWMEYHYQIDRNVFTEDGCYEIQLLSCDGHGNRNCFGSGGETIRFTVDHSAPEVLVTGLEDGMIYDDEVWTCVEVRDNSKLVEVSVYLDGIKQQTCPADQLEKQDCLIKWKTEGSGQWTTLQILAKDTAGNVTLTRPVSFLVDEELHSHEV